LEWLDLEGMRFVIPPFVQFCLAGIHGICSLMEMPVDGEPFVSFPALDRADGSLKVRSDLLPGIQMIVSLGIRKNGGAVAFPSWTS
jgi:hypothetical protein